MAGLLPFVIRSADSSPERGKTGSAVRPHTYVVKGRAGPMTRCGRLWDLTGPVVEWRVKVLVRAGFDGDLAAALSGCGSVDLHELLTLVDRGCPALLATRILLLDEGGDE